MTNVITKTAITMVTSKDWVDPTHSESERVSCASVIGAATVSVVSAMSGIHSGALRQIIQDLAGGFLFGVLLSRSFGASDKFWSIAVEIPEMGLDRKLLLVLRTLFTDQHI